MRIAVRYFASLREALGSGESVDVAAGTSIGSLRDQLIERGGRFAEVLGRSRAVRSALDQTMRDESAVLHVDAEVAFFPPVTGG